MHRPRKGSGVVGNAISIHGIDIEHIDPSDSDGLIYDVVTNTFKFVAVSGVGGLVFQDNWNADTNTPDLITSPPEAGKFWRVSVAGLTDLGGITDWGVRDWAVSKGAGVWIKVDNSEPPISTPKARFGWAVPDTNNLVETKHCIKSARGNRLSGVTVDSVTPQNHEDANLALILMEVTTMISSGTIRLTGVSVDIDTGVATVNDSENIIASSTGWYVSTKHFRGIVVVSSVDGLDVVLDSYLWDPVEFERDVIIESVQIQYRTVSVVNASRVVIERFNPSSGFTTLFWETIANLANNKNGFHHRKLLNYTFAESTGDRIHMYIATQGLTDYRIEVLGKEV